MSAVQWIAGLVLGACCAAAQAQRAEPVASGLAHPWAVAFIDGGRYLVTERAGRMRVVEANGKVGPAIGGVP